MSEFKDLEDAVASLQKAISNFPVGAISIDDLRPIEEKVIFTRNTLQYLNSRLLRLKAKQEMQSNQAGPKENFEDVVDLVHITKAVSILASKAIRLCLHSVTVQSIFSQREGDSETQKKISSYMCDLFTRNDGTISLQQQIEEAIHKQLFLKMECQKFITEYPEFLKAQEEIRRKKLQETNPQIAKNKEKMEKAIRKINIMKRLITNFIAASGHLLKDKPLLLEMAIKHRELINVATILKMSQNSTENSE